MPRELEVFGILIYCAIWGSRPHVSEERGFAEQRWIAGFVVRKSWRGGGGRGVGNKGCGRLVTMNEIKRNHDSKRKKIIQGKGWEGNGVS